MNNAGNADINWVKRVKALHQPAGSHYIHHDNRLHYGRLQ